MRAPAFVLAVALAGCAATASLVKRSEARIDTREQMSVIAAKLRPAARTPAWELTLPHPEIDDLVVLPGGKLLVGLVGVDVTQFLDILAFTPRRGPYLCVDAASGAVLWSHEREKSVDHSYGVLASGPVILLEHQTPKDRELIALDPQQGTKLWTVKLSLQAPVTASAQGGIAIANEPTGGLRAIDLSSGNVAWSAPPASDQSAPTLAIVGETLYELDKGLHVRDLRSGKERWSIKSVTAGVDRLPPTLLADGLVVAGPRGVTRIDAGGGVRWAAPLDAEPVWLEAAHGRVVVHTVRGDGPGQLTALDLGSGLVRWKRALPELPMSPFGLDPARIGFTTARTLELWDAATGRPVASIPLPARLKADRPLDRVLFEGNVVSFVGEQAVGGFRKEDGAPIYLHTLRGVADRTIDAAHREFKAVAGANPYGKGGGAAPAPAVAMTPDTAVITQPRVDFARFNEQRALSNEQMVRLDSRSSSGDRMAAAAASQRAIRERHEAEAHAAKVALVSAVVSTAANVGVGMALSGLDKSQYTSRIARRKLALELAYRAHATMLQDRYLVRPVRLRFGDGLLLVDVADGSWAEVPIAPFEGSVGKDAFLDSQLGLIADGHLIAKGISLDPAKWVPYPVSVGITTVQRSLFSVPLEGLPLKPAAEYATASAGRASLDVD